MLLLCRQYGDQDYNKMTSSWLIFRNRKWDTCKRTIAHSSYSAAIGLGLQLRGRQLATARKVWGSIPSTGAGGQWKQFKYLLTNG